MTVVDIDAKIPNNIDLAGDRRLQRALESWQPKFIEWWRQLGPVAYQDRPDDLDWDDEVRLALEERNSFSPDALTGMEANYRFPGPETMETKIFARLTAWQNWVFQRPNAVGPEGALQRFGTGTRPTYDRTRV